MLKFWLWLKGGFVKTEHVVADLHNYITRLENVYHTHTAHVVEQEIVAKEAQAKADAAALEAKTALVVRDKIKALVEDDTPPTSASPATA